VNLNYRISAQRHSPGLYPTPYFHFQIPVVRRQTCTAWVYGKYLIARPRYIVAMSVHLNSDYRISGREHSPGLYPTPYFHLRIPVTGRQTCTAWVYGKYLIARPPYIVAKSIHLNSGYRISGRGHWPGLYPTPYFHFRFPVARRQTCTAWVYGKYLIARPPYVVAMSIHLNPDYRISGRVHSPGLYSTPYFQLRFPVTRRQTCTAWVNGKYLIACPPYIVAKSIHHNSDLRVSISIQVIESPDEGIRLDYTRRYISTSGSQ